MDRCLILCSREKRRAHTPEPEATQEGLANSAKQKLQRQAEHKEAERCRAEQPVARQKRDAQGREAAHASRHQHAAAQAFLGEDSIAGIKPLDLQQDDLDQADEGKRGQKGAACGCKLRRAVAGNQKRESIEGDKGAR